MKDWMIKVTASSLIAGYATTVLQLTPGYRKTFAEWRKNWEKYCAEQSEKGDVVKWNSLSTLTRCGWCLTPWVASVVWLVVGRDEDHKLLGLLASASLASLIRHEAERM